MEKKKRGRPLSKEPSTKVTFNLKDTTIDKLRFMTTLGRNASAFVDALIVEKYNKSK